MKTLQSELIKYRQFVSAMRHFNPQQNQGKSMNNQTMDQSSRLTAKGSNTRYKRTPEELNADVEKVDRLIASGKFNQIEALAEVGLQSSVYHYKKRQQRLAPAKSLKPRKFAHRIRKATSPESYEQSKQKLLSEIDENSNKQDKKVKSLETELQELRAKFNKLKEFVIDNVILN